MLRGAAAFAVLFAVLLVSGRALAWQEAHQAGDDVVVSVDTAGTAQVQHLLKWHVVRGPLKYVDIAPVDAVAAVEPDVVVTAADGRSLLAHAARRDDRTVRLTLDQPRSLMRGDFTFDLRLRENLVAAHALTRDGATWRLTWSPPVAQDGFDAVHTTFDLAAAPDAPEPILADTGALDDAAVAKVTRLPGRDRLELVRPHVGRGEAPLWTVRVDPKALASIPDPRGPAALEAAAPPEPDRVRETSLAVGLGALALLFGLVVRRKASAFAAACAARGATARAIVPLPDGMRALLAGIALSAGVGLEVAGRATLGAACVALAAIAAAQRAPARTAKARGPGKWLAIRPEEAFAPGPSTWTADAFAVLAAAVAVGGLALLARRFDPMAPWLVLLDASALVPLLLTGRASQLPPDAARAPAPWLAHVFRALRRVPELRVSPWSRVPLDAHAPDELRLLVLPRASMPGVLGIELGLAWSSTPAGWTGAPEVLARVLDGSPAAARLARELPSVRAVPGRRPDEKVLRLLPRRPTRAATVALSRSLAGALTDRREAAPARAWTASERRSPRPAPPAAAAAAA
ncbi:MAG TPA: hypothetical protein VGG39_18320 [Polyangiaceae bacterium]|jgi:hypothetical protein